VFIFYRLTDNYDGVFDLIAEMSDVNVWLIKEGG
jgi:hypothetical protein